VELILVRHALPERVELETGIADPALQPLGRHQAQRVADWLAHESIDHIVASPKRRALETAAPLARRIGLDVEVLVGLTELDKAATHYIPVEEMRSENNALWQALMRGDWAAAGYQDPIEFRAEVVACIETLVEERDGQTVVVFAHAGTINAVISHLLGHQQVFVFGPDYTSISRVRRNPHSGRLTVATLNETAHLHAGRNTLAAL
jgi:probable phosphoglycerate mutase